MDADVIDPTPHRVPWVAVAVFLVLAFGGAWLVALPLWTSGLGLRHPLAGLLLPAMMFTPLAAAAVTLLVVRSFRPRPVLAFLGVWPLRPFGRTIWTSVGTLVGMALVPFAAAAIAAWVGWLPVDLVHFSGFRDTLAAAGAGDLPLPVEVLVLVQIASIPVGAIVNAFLTVGEEVGWRGFLVPALRPLGAWPAVVLSGAIWGLWHAPIILLGYDFDRTDPLGLGCMVVACALLGTVLGWTRLRTGSVWPAVFGHGALNAAAGVGALVVASGAPVDAVLAGPLGVSTWIVVAAVVVVLVVTGFAGREARLQSAPSPSLRRGRSGA